MFIYKLYLWIHVCNQSLQVLLHEHCSALTEESQVQTIIYTCICIFTARSATSLTLKLVTCQQMQYQFHQESS